MRGRLIAHVRISNHPMKDLADTICALSTPPGRSGLAVVRVSGPETDGLLRQIFETRQGFDAMIPRRAVLGRIVDPRDGTEIDEAIATRFQAPHSYTGEDMSEFSLHGSPVLIFSILDCLCALGARMAEPGEFTMRAFLHGRIDLTQAEAVRDIIEATTLYQAQVAARQRSGGLAQGIRPVKQQLIDLIVNLESAVEFADQELPVSSRETAAKRLETIRQQLQEWIRSFRQGRVIRNGFSLAIVGRPNVGKSSLFNALLAQNRSIVAEIPGTTRDLVTEYTNIGGIPVHLQDTAGIHDAQGVVEKLGIDRSRQAIADADAVLLVADTSRPPAKEDRDLIDQLRPLRCIVVMNKSDLPSRWSPGEKSQFADGQAWAEVSAKTGSGIDGLRGILLDQILGPAGTPRDGLLVTNLRHCRNLGAAEQDLSRAEAALKNGLSEEFALVDLHRGLRNLDEITGETGVEDLLDEIFSQFCVGK